MAVFTPAAHAQTIKASISGIVSDSTGAVLAGSKVTARDLDRGLTFSANTNETGFYLIPELNPGNYELTAEMAGFRTYVLDRLPLQTQQKATVNITMEVGMVTERVEVTGSAQMIESTSATLSSVVENKKIVDLPLNNRNVYSLLRLVPGVAPSTPNGDSDFFTGAHRYSVNGGRESLTDVQVDGISALAQSDIPGIYASSANPSVEGVEEFRVQTNAFSSEYGRSGGGLVTMVTKSGANAFHGSLFEFLRNSKMDSNSWQANRAGSRLPSLQQNQFGGSAGGRIIKDKTFFFGVYEGKRINTSGFGQWTVPTALERQGDFSQTRNAAGNVRVVYDPFTTRPDPNRPGFYLRDPIPGNRIATTRIDPVSAKVIKYWPEPNQPGQANTNALNLGLRASFLSPTDRYEFKVDHNFTERRRMFLRYGRFKQTSADYDYWKNKATPVNGVMYWGSHAGNFDYTETIGASTVFNGRVGVNRFSAYRPSFSYPFDVSQEFGWPANISDTILKTSVPKFPEIAVQDVATLGGVQGAYYVSANTQYTGVASVSRVTGRHTTKVGFEARLFYLAFAQYSSTPSSNFSRTMTQGPDPRSPSEIGGFGFASFLLGTADSGALSHVPKPYNYNKYYALYVQDDFKVNRKLTLNYGLRWEMETGVAEKYDRLSGMDVSTKNPLSSSVGFDVFGGYIFPGKGLDQKGIRALEHKFNPRFGIAYEFNPKLVIRTGYGIFYGVPPFAATNGFTGAPYSSATSFLATLDGITPNYLFKNPFPDSWNLPPGSSQGLLAQVGQTLSTGWPQALKTAYNQQWNFTIQREFAKSTVLELAYAGNKGTHLDVGELVGPDMNQLRPELVKPENNLTELVRNPFFGYITVGALAQPTVQRGQLLKPYPHFSSVRPKSTAWGNSNYHAFQTRFERRFSGGTSFAAAYTYSKIISDGSDGRWNDATQPAGGRIRSWYCRTCDRAISSYDVKHRLVLNFTYELPFGKGKAMGAGWNRATDLILGGWQMNGILTLASGQPIVITQASNTSFTFGGFQHPDSTGVEANLGDAKTLARWFDVSQFKVAQAYDLGNMGRVHPSIRQDSTRVMDFSLFKMMSITERWKLQFRAEAFNLANTPVFSKPDANIQSVTVGQVNSQNNPPRQIQLALKLLF
jgi:hypothetical protein